ncbi:Cna protein B-type domain-containing protein [Ruminococcaceae bacterium YRB3002]|nr:Cna protein B-type domain-containing protein [Ruminococcaceae bacterium YRB3002]
MAGRSKSVIRSITTVLAALLIAVLFFAPARTLYAAGQLDPDKDSSLTMTLKTPGDDGKTAVGAEVTVYRVAEGRYGTGGGIDFVLTSDYAATSLDLENKITQSMIDDVAQFTVDNSVAGVASETSDADGKVVFEGLKSGVYLVMATSLPTGFTSFVPFLYFLPYYSTDPSNIGWQYDGVAEPKLSYLEPIDITVRKVWNDDGKDRPDHVDVALSNEDGVFETVTLNDSNNWQYKWTTLDASRKWDISEVNVPAEYKVTYSRVGNDFTVTNTKKLIQTGQTNWPVPVMVFAGLFLVSAGIIVRVTGKRSYEE